MSALGIACLLGTASLAWALFWAHAELPGNSFQTGDVKIDLNGGKPVFSDGVFVEPGGSQRADFTITNTGSADCYWRLRLTNPSGDLDDALAITITDQRTGKTLYSGPLAGLEDPDACAGADELRSQETLALTAVITMDRRAGNDYQGAGASFDLVADATQARNNAGREF